MGSLGRVALRSRQTLQQPALRYKSLEASHGSTTAAAQITDDWCVAQLPAKGHGVGMKFTIQHDGSANAFTKINQQKILAAGLGGEVSQRQCPDLLHQENR